MPRVVTTFKDITSPTCEARAHERTVSVPAMGKSYCHITCPFCSARVRAFLWSLAGGGKRCPCGALHGNFGDTYKKRRP